ncbi:hypothetical protein [Streptomyces sp. NPDC012888]|uniref:hypothetical protein n=1 Tax=Streptomyces sp. NPDC012888 TaxID=3364855 RepID=UPI0036B2B197
MAAPATPARPHRLTVWQGRMLLRFIALVQRRLAANPSRPDVALRNAAMRAAHRRGVGRSELVATTGLSGQTVGRALAGGPTAE